MTDVKVMVVDDTTPMREQLSALLGMVDGLSVVATAGDGAEAADRAAEARPDVVVMDVKMPNVDGIEGTRRLLEVAPRARVIMHSAYGDESLVVEALMAGAAGYLLKDSTPAEIVDAVRAAGAGESRISGHVTRPLLDRLVALLNDERRLREDSQREAAAANAVAEALTRFATMAGHELRTPVTSLLGGLATLDRLVGDGGPAHEMLDMARRQAARVARLADDLTVVARVQAGEPLLSSRELLPVALAVAGVVNDARVDVEGLDGLVALADGDSLAHALGHLVRNALSHSPDGERVLVSGRQAGGTVEIRVADRGPGIPPERIADLFDRLGERSEGDVNGLGVGLWVAKRLTEATGGTLTASDRPGGGAVFLLTLPAGQ